MKRWDCLLTKIFTTPRWRPGMVDWNLACELIVGPPHSRQSRKCQELLCRSCLHENSATMSPLFIAFVQGFSFSQKGGSFTFHHTFIRIVFGFMHPETQIIKMMQFWPALLALCRIFKCYVINLQ